MIFFLVSYNQVILHYHLTFIRIAFLNDFYRIYNLSPDSFNVTLLLKKTEFKAWKKKIVPWFSFDFGIADIFWECWSPSKIFLSEDHSVKSFILSQIWTRKNLNTDIFHVVFQVSGANIYDWERHKFSKNQKYLIWFYKKQNHFYHQQQT